MLRLMILVMSFLLTQASWAGRIQLSPAANKVQKKNVIAVWAEWVKDKGEKFDVRLGIQNIGDTPMIVLLRDIGCTKGKSKGNMKHTFFNTGEKTIDFQGGETKTMNLVCRLPHDTTGLLGMIPINTFKYGT